MKDAIDCSMYKFNHQEEQTVKYLEIEKDTFRLTCKQYAIATRRIIDAVVLWPGGTRDPRILDNSILSSGFENNEFGDCGFPCRIYLITPLLNSYTTAEQRYHNAHIRTRKKIGVLKKRLPCLSK